MPLTDGYGVLSGTITNYYRDPPDNAGRYYHGNLIITAPRGQYRCAIDVDSHQSNTGVEWRVVELQAQELTSVTGLAAGYHPLVSNASSGAIDYIRSQSFAVRIGCLAAILAFLGKPFNIADLWKRGTSIAALSDLEPLVTVTQTNSFKALIFGEPFTNGLGMHNIHQNQGDPLGSQWAAENGIWQDGCTVLQQSADKYVAFLNKFTTQSYSTDAQGHPA
jgi:uncharacterized protein YukJ